MSLLRQHLKLLLLLLLLLHSICSFTTAQSLASNCQGTNRTANASYFSDVTRLLNYFTSLNSTNFTTHTSGNAYGLFLCRGDVGPTDCSNCIHSAAKDVLALCPNYTRATVWYDYCQLRYSDTRFFGTADTSIGTFLINTKNTSDPKTFIAMENELLGNITNRAVSSNALFATGNATNGKSTPVNGLVQCTRDISASLCSQCLQEIVQEYMSSGYEVSIGGRIITKSCNFRLESYTFFQGNPMLSLNLSPSPPTPSAPSNVPSILPPTGQGRDDSSNTGKILAIVIPTVVVVLLMLAIFVYFWRKRAAQTFTTVTNLEEISTIDSMMLELSVLKVATNDFAEANKLGQGGFGSVYKGTLSNGQEIAVKRLAVGSTQGIDELKNELFLVAKLQHRNLVRLRGVCLEEEEKLLVYEYVPNRSLDNFLFDPIKCKQLNWARRFNIIGGIARGLFYLHEESHLKVVHRDLKASNILLDTDMNPKISDFGLARLFGGDETQGLTSRVVGTFGYMAPEYALHGQFSTKVDVYSYGVLALEIVTGRKNSSFLDSARNQDILSYVWEHWTNGTILDIMDPSLDETSSRSEVMRCIHIALLCVQEIPSQRPPMSSVVLMLHSPSVPLQAPLQPRFFTKVGVPESDMSGKQKDVDSALQVRHYPVL